MTEPVSQCSSHFVSRTGGQDELAVGVEGQTVDLCSVGIYCMTGFGCVIGARVPAKERGEIRLKYCSHYITTVRAVTYLCKLHNVLKVIQSTETHRKTKNLHHKLLVICYRPKERLVQQMPRHVLHYSRVTSENGLSIHYFSLLWHCTDVPQTDSLQKKTKLEFLVLAEFKNK